MIPDRPQPANELQRPLGVPGWEAEGVDATPRYDRAIAGFVLLGVALRVVRYATNQPLWGDEAYLAASLIDRDLLGLLRPLEYHQVAPLLFLWVELAIVRVLGFAEWTLRLFPVLCGVAAVLLFAHLARRTLDRVPALLAVAIFAVAFYPVRHATEVKPYATDLLAALVLILPAVAWWQDRASARPLWLLAALTPLVLGFSYPAVFVAGGIALALGPMVARAGDRRAWAAYLGFGLALTGSFLILHVIVIQGQTAAAGAGMARYWAEAFPPPATRPGALLAWLVEAHTSRAFAYPLGEANGGSAFTTMLVLVGALVLWRRGRRGLLAILVAPLALGLVAAARGDYPYGGSARTMQYIAPMICLLAGLGAARLIGLARCDRRRSRLMLLSTATLAAIGLAAIGLDVARPYKFAEDDAARRFAKRFWGDEHRDAELACVRRDLGATIDPVHWQTGRSAVYLCNQAIYSARSSRDPALNLARVSADHPLRCVLYNLDREHPDFRAWLDSMADRYELRRVATYEPVPMRSLGGLEYEDRYEVYDFAPRDGEAAPQVAHRGEASTTNAPLTKSVQTRTHMR